MRLRATAGLSTGIGLAAAIVVAIGSIAPAPAQQRPGSPSKPKFSERQIMATKDWANGDCTDVTRLTGIEGRSDAELSETFGAPARKETFRLGERQDEFHITLQNHYPLSVAANAKIELQEWTWEKGKCRLTVWLHKPAATWVAVENIRYPADAEF
jgi:hypothetical protein